MEIADLAHETRLCRLCCIDLVQNGRDAIDASLDDDPFEPLGFKLQGGWERWTPIRPPITMASCRPTMEIRMNNRAVEVNPKFLAIEWLVKRVAAEHIASRQDPGAALAEMKSAGNRYADLAREMLSQRGASGEIVAIFDTLPGEIEDLLQGVEVELQKKASGR